MITVREIFTRKELKEFVKFPFQIFKNNPYWIPPIISEELDTFDQEKNPAFEQAEARFFMAYKNEQPAGRIAAIINHTEINKQQLKKMRFGWFDVIDDIQVTQALLDKVHEIGKKNLLEFVEGPVGFSNLDKVGVMTDGFDQLGTSLTWYSQPYYKDHLSQLGYLPEKKFIESYFYFGDVDNKNFDRFAKIIETKYHFKALNFSTTKEIYPYVDEMFALFNETYSKLASFVPISGKQINYFKEKYLRFIHPEFVKFVSDENNKLIAFAITMPSYSRAMQKAGGHLFPFGFLHLLKAKRKNDTVDFYLIGVLPEYQKKGVTSIIFSEYFKTYKKHHIKIARRTPELEDNQDIQLIWKNFNPKIYIRRATFLKKIH